jgi:hypothetical protein
MSTIKKYLGSRSTLEIKQEILKDFSEALNLELKVELANSEDNDLFTRSTFELKLDNGIIKYVHCDIFDLIQCFYLNKKEAINEALLKRFNNLGSFKGNSIYVEHVDNHFHFFELIPREMNNATDSMLSLLKLAKINSVEIPTIKDKVQAYLDNCPSRFPYLRKNLDLVDWEIVEENQILGTYKPN